MYTVCILHVYCVYTACILCVYRMYTVCILCVYCLYTVCIPCVRLPLDSNISGMLNVVLASIPICVLGTVFNVLCFCYFVRRTSRKLAKRLLMFLNVLDIAVCLSGTISAALYYFYLSPQLSNSHLDTSYWVVTVVFSTGLLGTAFATCLISCTRSIVMCFPFYKINDKCVLLSILLFLILQTVRQTVFAVADALPGGKDIQKWVGITGIVILILIIVSVLVSNLVCILKLRTCQSETNRAHRNSASRRASHSGDIAAERARRATVTVITLSVIFCVLNSLYIGGYLLNLYVGQGKELPFYRYTVWLVIPLNSLLNPVVYFSRKKGVRSLLTQHLRSLSRAAAQ